jgi:hypothetical protein
MDANIDPVIRKFIGGMPSVTSSSSGLVQTRMDAHLISYKDDTRFAKFWSKRLSTAVVNITGQSNSKIIAERPQPQLSPKEAKAKEPKEPQESKETSKKASGGKRKRKESSEKNNDSDK